jgi:glycine betaine/proline transport system permease protein
MDGGALGREAAALDASIQAFVGRNHHTYIRAFAAIQSTTGLAWTFNWGAAAFGPLWAAARNLWGLFWIFSILELAALVQIGRGVRGDLGAADLARASRLYERAAVMLKQAEEAALDGRSNAEALRTIANNMTDVAKTAEAAAQAATSGATVIALLGLGALVALRLIEGFYANIAYEARYSRWRVNRAIAGGLSLRRLVVAIALTLAVAPVTMYRLSTGTPIGIVTAPPADRDLHSAIATWLNVGLFDRMATAGGGLLAGVTQTINWLLGGVEAMLTATPWLVTATVIVALAGYVAGYRVALLAAAGLAYLVLFGFWEKSMITVALLGTAALLCTTVGLPLGVLCGKSQTADSLVRPMLDFMQTMPSFVYLIPVIAFFGTGKPAGIIATVIFGMPPVARLTALGIRNVPEPVREAAVAFGCGPRKLLLDVEIPLAMPAIMAGVNQTILMCLGMVVIASLIGAEGLGHDILIALEYVAKGEGLLAGLAVLFCAMIIDRVVQGRFAGRDAQAGILRAPSR